MNLDATSGAMPHQTPNLLGDPMPECIHYAGYVLICFVIARCILTNVEGKFETSSSEPEPSDVRTDEGIDGDSR